MPVEFITKERLIQAVWPDTFVTDDALKYAIVSLRRIHADDASEPRYIRTIPRRGYQLVADVELPEGPGHHTGWRPGNWMWALAAVLMLTLVSTYWAVREGPQAPSQVGLDLSAAPRPLTSLPGIEKDPAISPDGSQVAFAWNGGEDKRFHIYTTLVGGGTRFAVTRAAADNTRPVWSPTQDRIAFLRSVDRRLEVWWVSFPNGEEKLVYVERQTGESPWAGIDWSPDGRFLAFEDLVGGTGSRAIFVLDVRVAGQPS